MNDIILQRITDVELAKWCNQYGLELKQITPYQLRVESLIDFYPKRNRYFLLREKTWHTAQTVDDLRKALAGTIPQLEAGLDISKLKEWYYDLCKTPYSDFANGQLTMLSNILQLVLTDEEYEKINNMPDAIADANRNGQEKLI